MGNPEFGPASDLATPLKSNTRHALWQESDNTTQKDITMFRFAQRFGRHSQERHARARRPRSFNASLEVVENRTLMSTLSAISWNSGGVEHTEVFAIGVGNAVYMNKDSSSWVSLGGNVKAISAGLTAAGNPEVFGIGTDNAVYFNSGSGWGYLGGDVKAISATADNTVFGIGTDNAVYVNSGSGWGYLGGNVKAISAGLDAAGNPEVFGIGTDNAAYVNDDERGFVDLGGYVTEISGTTDSTLYVRGENLNSVYVNYDGVGFGYLGNIPLANPLAATGYSPAPASAQLFNNNEPSYLDVDQGAVGDCWLVASLAEVAARDPQDIKNMFTPDKTTVDNGATVGLYTVRLFSSNGSAFDVEVDTELPSAGEYYDHVDNALGTQVLWVALAEKAYAEANSLGYVTTNNEYQDSYNALGGGDPSWALQAITGKSASDYSINPTNVVTAWNSGQLVVLCTGTPTSSYIVGDHCYAMVGYNASSGEPFEVFNPWGTNSSGWAPSTYNGNPVYGLFTASAAFISQNYDEQSLGTGAINVNSVTEPVNGLTGSATGNGGYARTGTINLTRHSPGGVADAETAAARGGDRPTAGDARPAQGTATGVDLWLASYAGDGDDPTTRVIRGHY